jgi:predicted phosphoadenosine phosphosulfate sulfurtransferase
MWFRDKTNWRGNLGNCVIVLINRSDGWYYRFEGIENGRKWVTTDEGPYRTAYLAGLYAVEEAKLYDIDRRMITQLSTTLSALV